MTPSDLGQIKTKNPFDPTSLGYAQNQRPMPMNENFKDNFVKLIILNHILFMKYDWLGFFKIM